MDLDSSWARLPEGARQALEQQWRGVAAGGLPCGASVVDRTGAVVASGRNRAYEAPSGDDPLEHTRLAHAELNALARVPSDVDHQTLAVWSTQHPCSMCAAAIAFTGVGAVHYVADDPSDHTSLAERELSRAGVAYAPLGDPLWWTAANLLFLYSAAEQEGAAARNLATNRDRYPELVEFVLVQARDGAVGDAARGGVTLPGALGPLWPAIEALSRPAAV